MQMERDGEKFYSELAGNTQVEGIRTIMTMLAGEEVKHYNTIALLKKQAGYTLTPETEVLGKVKNIFLRMKDEKAELRFDSSELESYRKARDIEEVSRTFYLAKGCRDPTERGETDISQPCLRRRKASEDNGKYCRICCQTGTGILARKRRVASLGRILTRGRRYEEF